MDSKSLISTIEKAGWKLHRIKGSHDIFINPEKAGIVIIPHPKRDLPKGTINSILKQAGLK